MTHSSFDLLVTHLSARVPDSGNYFLINPFGMLFEKINASPLARVDKDGRMLSEIGYRINQTGFKVHSTVHMSKPDLGCLIYSHTRTNFDVVTQKLVLLPLIQYANSSKDFIHRND